MTICSTILFAGGGSGGHIFPNLAIAEQLSEQEISAKSHFLVSNRTLDHQLLDQRAQPYTAIPAQPLTARPLRLMRWFNQWRASVRCVKRLIETHDVAALVATGGFVSGPAVAAARSLGRPVGLVNLDAVPGKANRLMAPHATQIFTAYDVVRWPHAIRIGVPLRRAAIGEGERPSARLRMGLEPDRPVLLVCGGSQGAKTLNDAMLAMADQLHTQGQWQVLHICGPNDVGRLRQGYERTGVSAVVQPFCDEMGLAWRSADLALSRAGASSVAEVQANHVPTVFFPFPFHKDQHQRLNAEPLIKTGSALLISDKIDPADNATTLWPSLVRLMSDERERARMKRNLRQLDSPNGATQVAKWVVGGLGTKIQLKDDAAVRSEFEISGENRGIPDPRNPMDRAPVSVGKNGRIEV